MTENREDDGKHWAQSSWSAHDRSSEASADDRVANQLPTVQNHPPRRPGGNPIAYSPLSILLSLARVAVNGSSDTNIMNKAGVMQRMSCHDVVISAELTDQQP
jgi:hypothetical protein